ncbi:MAG TPA: hypothetical protein PLU67_07655 [Candidatus Kapabacteria bacterium]|jgi:hypothetical protein|nr:hypothetical protein [Candidatus Kapabacteria bacterium]HOM05352.1 hypothetical protein [Candidatus Kapabacteria bacterium]HPP39980.1 hypothetical protein [Candidatus Kapabacteria bacterium]HPU24140.1 hypothetical protein [Candidatus Kapabacteria bacterium]
MKKIVIISLIFILSITYIHAEQTKVISIGPFLGYKAGVSAVNTPLGRKNGLSFNNIPDFGVCAYFPLSKQENIGLKFDASYSTYSYMMISAHNDKKEYKLSHNYLSFSPSFYFNNFSIGFSYLIPSNSKIEGSEIKTKIQNNVFELKIGYEFPIYEDNSGELNGFVIGGYFLSGVFDNFPKNDPFTTLLPAEEKVTNVHNPRIASIQIGFNFMFNLKEKPKSEIPEDMY